MKKKEVTDVSLMKMQPHDLDTELAVLSSLITYNDKFSLYSDLLNEDLFYYEREKMIWKCVKGVIEGGGITDVNSLWHYAQQQGMDKLFRNDFVEIISKSNKETIGQDIGRLCDMARRRRYWRGMTEAAQRMLDLTNDFDEEYNKLMAMLRAFQDELRSDGTTSNDEAEAEIEQIAEKNTSEMPESLVSGFAIFDRRYLLRPDTLTVIAAFTSVGKSALAMNIVKGVAKGGTPCAYYSKEMSRVELAARLLSEDADLPSSAILYKRLNESEMARLKKSCQMNKGLPIYFDDRATVDFDRTMRSIRTMVRTKGVKLVVIDYLQIYSQVIDDEEQNISYMCRTAKNVAKELGIAVLLISQLNRSALHPSIKMLRGSGQIEESADNVVLIDRPEAYPDNKVKKYEGKFEEASINGTAKLILAKGRGVGVDCQLVAFNGKHARFTEIEKPEGGTHYEHEEDMPF